MRRWPGERTIDAADRWQASASVISGHDETRLLIERTPSNDLLTRDFC